MWENSRNYFYKKHKRAELTTNSRIFVLNENRMFGFCGLSFKFVRIFCLNVKKNTEISPFINMLGLNLL